MANSLQPMSPTFWSRIMGKKAYKNTVFRALASFEEQATLTKGLKVDRPYRSNLRVSNYVKGTAATAQDVTGTSDQLTIDKQKTILIYIDDVDAAQNKWDMARAYAEEAGLRLGIVQDAYFLYEVVNAANTLDDGDFGGTSGSPVSITTWNVMSLFGKVNRKLDQQNVDMGRQKRFLAISPQVYEVLWNYISGKESLLGDKTGEFGNIGTYGGLTLYVTNNLTASAVWTPANDPSNADTITISGVTFTAVTSIGSTAGNFLVGTNLATSLDNLVALINDPGTTSSTQVGFTGANLDTVSDMVAVDGTTYITVYHKGQSFLTVTNSDSNDPWSKKTQHLLGGVKGAIDMVTQIEPSMGPDSMASTVSAGKRGQNVMPLLLFGVKTFDQGTREIVNIKVASSSFS